MTESSNELKCLPKMLGFELSLSLMSYAKQYHHSMMNIPKIETEKDKKKRQEETQNPKHNRNVKIKCHTGNHDSI